METEDAFNTEEEIRLSSRQKGILEELVKTSDLELLMNEPWRNESKYIKRLEEEQGSFHAVVSMIYKLDKYFQGFDIVQGKFGEIDKMHECVSSNKPLNHLDEEDKQNLIPYIQEAFKIVSYFRSVVGEEEGFLLTQNTENSQPSTLNDTNMGETPLSQSQLPEDKPLIKVNLSDIEYFLSQIHITGKSLNILNIVEYIDSLEKKVRSKAIYDLPNDANTLYVAGLDTVPILNIPPSFDDLELSRPFDSKSRKWTELVSPVTYKESDLFCADPPIDMCALTS